MPSECQPIKPEICDYLEFPVILVCVQAGLDRLPLADRRATHRKLMRFAAKQIRNLLLNTADQSKFARIQLYATISRVIWHSDVKSAFIFLQPPDLARRHITIRGSNVFLNDTQIFSKETMSVNATDS